MHYSTPTPDFKCSYFLKKGSDYSNIKSSWQYELKTVAYLPYLQSHMHISEREKATHLSDSGTDSGTMVLDHWDVLCLQNRSCIELKEQ